MIAARVKYEKRLWLECNTAGCEHEGKRFTAAGFASLCPACGWILSIV